MSGKVAGPPFVLKGGIMAATAIGIRFDYNKLHVASGTADSTMQVFGRDSGGLLHTQVMAAMQHFGANHAVVICDEVNNGKGFIQVRDDLAPLQLPLTETGLTCVPVTRDLALAHGIPHPDTPIRVINRGTAPRLPNCTIMSWAGGKIRIMDALWVPGSPVTATPWPASRLSDYDEEATLADGTEQALQRFIDLCKDVVVRGGVRHTLVLEPPIHGVIYHGLLALSKDDSRQRWFWDMQACIALDGCRNTDLRGAYLLASQ